MNGLASDEGADREGRAAGAATCRAQIAGKAAPRGRDILSAASAGRRNALFLRLKATSPSLFAAVKPQLPPPMAIGSFEQLVARLELDLNVIGQAICATC